jgi:hypothetical protein
MGHLFVAQGDLTKLACDAVIIPCDSDLNVNPVWVSVLPANLPAGDGDWLRLPGVACDHGIVKLPDSNGRRVCAVIAVEGQSEPGDVVDRVWRALSAVAGGLDKADTRALPLVGVPLVGTGDGGLHGRRAEVIDKLLRRHRDSPVAADLALILNDRRDFAAVQVRRVDDDWMDLDHSLLEKADRLGELAGSRQLSLFLGAGISQPAGLPSWWGLLEQLAEAAGMALSQEVSPFDAAIPIVTTLGARYYDEMKARVDVPRHAVGHALLASLRVKQMVTTNFDPCLELALASVLDGNFRVLTRELADGALPWLLKLHGDIRRPESIVLTSADVNIHREENQALQGVVQSLLLTSHLLFVGFSLTDESFLDLAAAVTRVRNKADRKPTAGTGTAIALTPNGVDAARYKDLDMFPVLDDDAKTVEASRLLEIFLDRLCWKAASENDLVAEYLLDDRYVSGLSAADSDLRDILKKIENLSSGVESTPGWRPVARALTSLGADLRR